MGGGAAVLNDAFIRNEDIDYICYHHEQGAGYGAVAEARLTKTWGILNPTTGCGGSNCLTPVLNAWQDSVPLVVISGNVSLPTCSSHLNSTLGVELRGFGIQEHNILANMGPTTKFADVVEEPDHISDLFIQTLAHAKSARQGPVWLDVPQDIQGTVVSKNTIERLATLRDDIEEKIAQLSIPQVIESDFSKLTKLLKQAKRPMVLLGGGANKIPKVAEKLSHFIKSNELPIAATYSGTDVVEHSYSGYLGCAGVKGSRAANFSLQNCDFLLVLGSRLPHAVIGYDVSAFAKNAKIGVVEIDRNEIKKNTHFLGDRVVNVHGTIDGFLAACPQSGEDVVPNITADWKTRCSVSAQTWDTLTQNKQTYDYQGISICHVMEALNRTQFDEDIFSSDAGSISYVAPVTLKYGKNRQFVFSPAQADMGCALPSAIGAAVTHKDRRVICVTGDGSLMSNLQELATLKYHDCNLILVLLNNKGYMSISNTQRNNFSNRRYGESEGRGISFPNYEKIADAFGINYIQVNNVDKLDCINEINGPVLVEVVCLEQEVIAPFQSRINGKQAGIHDMAPHLPLEDLIKFGSVDLDFERFD
jgi:acetolactate synthase I/II/III large subunit